MNVWSSLRRKYIFKLTRIGFLLKKLTSDDLRKIFDPVTDQIVSLVQQQIAETRAEVGKDIINVFMLHLFSH